MPDQPEEHKGGQMQAAAYQARWVIPIDQPPIDGGVVTIAKGRIVSVGKTTAAQPVHDLGDVALIPGLINAHTHLDFSTLPRPLGHPGMPFPEWIATVVRHRQEQTKVLMAETDGFQRSRRRAAQAGIAETLESGVSAIGDITSPFWPRACFPVPGLSSTIFLELIGLDAGKHDSLLKMARSFVLDVQDMAGDVRAGISPHAPYTVSPQLVQSICGLSAVERFPVAMHLAESLEELELLATKRGRMVDVLQGIDAWHPEVISAGTTPGDYLQWLATAHRSLVIHGNYLKSEEIHFLGSHHDRMSVVYCPRTHAYFGHERYPLAEMLAAGVRVALGTDSRASNPDLRLLEELKLVATQHSKLPAEQILQLGTLAGAQALGIEHDYGSIKPGKLARLAAIEIEGSPQDPYSFLFDRHSAAKTVR